MNKEFILNFRSLLKNKLFFKIKINTKQNKKYKNFKIKNDVFIQELTKVNVPKIQKNIMSFISKSKYKKDVFNLKMKFNTFIHYILLFKIEDEYVIKNINKIYNLIPFHLDKFNYENPSFIIEKTPHNIFKIISYNEKFFKEKSFMEKLQEPDFYYYLLDEVIVRNIILYQSEVNDE